MNGKAPNSIKQQKLSSLKSNTRKINSEISILSAQIEEVKKQQELLIKGLGDTRKLLILMVNRLERQQIKVAQALLLGDPERESSPVTKWDKEEFKQLSHKQYD